MWITRGPELGMDECPTQEMGVFLVYLHSKTFISCVIDLIIDRSPRFLTPLPADAEFLRDENKKILKLEISWQPESARSTLTD